MSLQQMALRDLSLLLEPCQLPGVFMVNVVVVLYPMRVAAYPQDKHLDGVAWAPANWHPILQPNVSQGNPVSY